jgi:hypothetical protein
MDKLIGGLAFAAGSIAFSYFGLRDLRRLVTGKVSTSNKPALAFQGVFEVAAAIALAVAVIALIEASIPD